MPDKYGLLSSPIPKVLQIMTLPMVIGLLSVLTFNLVDTFFISLLGTQHLAAVSFTFPVTFGISCITQGIGTGLSTNVGQLLGQGVTKKTAQLSSHGILLALLLVSLASSIGYFTIDPLFTALGAEPDLLPLIRQYMQVWYLTIPLLVIPITGNSVIKATGDTKTPAVIMMISGLINGVLDPLLIFGYGPFPELGIQGAAIASAVSWLGAVIASSYILIKREQLLAPPFITLMFKDWLKILKIATPATFSSAMTPLCGAVLMTILAKLGTEVVAAYGAAQRVESIMLIVMMSLSSVLTPFIAQNIGANQLKRSFSALFISMRFAVIFQFSLFILMVPLSMSITSLFSQEQAVQDTLWFYLITVPISYGFQGIIMMMVSCLNAMHMPVKAFLWNFARLFAFTLPTAWVGSQLYGAEGLFCGVAIGNVVGGILAYGYAIRLRKHYLLNSVLELER